MEKKTGSKPLALITRRKDVVKFFKTIDATALKDVAAMIAPVVTVQYYAETAEVTLTDAHNFKWQFPANMISNVLKEIDPFLNRD